MASERHFGQAIVVVWALSCGLAAPGQEFGGGTGEPNNPYLITSAQELIDLGNTPDVYDKHFRLTGDIDLAGVTFDRAVIAPDTKASGWSHFLGVPFDGEFDGNGHVIHNLRIEGRDYLGLFGCLGARSVVRDLGIETTSIHGDTAVGGLAGESSGVVQRCYAGGAVTGFYSVGGLIGDNDQGLVSHCQSSGEVSLRWNHGGGLVGCNTGSLSNCHSAAEIETEEGFYVGGLVGCNSGSVVNCYSTGAIRGYAVYAGGLVGRTYTGWVSNCYSSGAVAGWHFVGGLIGGAGECCISGCYSRGAVTGHDTVGGLIGVSSLYTYVSHCYSTGRVTGDENGGGLVGENHGNVVSCFWDTTTSGLGDSAGGVGLATAAMQAMDTYLGAGWDFVGERANGTGETWQMRQAGGYPRLSLFEGYEHTQPQGRGTLTEPFLITSAEELGSVRYRPLDCYRLEGDVDLSGVTWGVAVAPWFGGHFDGNGHVIRHLSIQGGGFLGLFGGLDYDSVVWDLGLANASVEGTSDAIGALAGDNHATVTSCYSTGAVTGNDDVGGLIGLNYGIVSDCYSTSAASGDIYAGGLIGDNDGDVSNCYSAGEITRASTDRRGGPFAGGLVGSNYEGSVVNCFWDTETSGVASGIYGVGLTTAEMQELTRYLEAGWDFAGESDNGTTETWQMPPEGGHPRLSVFKGYEAVVPEGQGTRAEPFLIRTAAELGSIGHRPLACYRLANDIDLSEMTWSAAPIKWFGGHFDGDGHVVRGLQVEGASLLGLFGTLAADAVITNLDLEGGSVTGRGWYVGFLVGRNDGTVITCHTTGDVSGEHRLIGGLVGYNCRGSVSDCYSAGAVTGGDWAIGGLVGYNWGGMSNCSSSGEVMGEDVIGGLVGNNGGRVSSGWASGAVTGDGNVGGLVGVNWGTVSNCYGAGAVAGNDEVGGLIGGNGGTVWNCYSTGVVAGDDAIGGLVGDNDHGDVLNCYSVGAVSGIGDTGGLVGEGSGRVTNSFWDVEASGVEHSGGGTGLTTAEMMDPEWVGLQGWAGNPDWVLDPHLDYPRLAWEVTGGQIIPAPVIDWMVGDGTSETPYEIHNVSQFVTITKASLLRQKRLVLMADLDLAQLAWPQAPLPDFGGTLDGNGHAIRNLTISGSSYLGLVRRLEEGGAIVNLGLVDVNVAGTGARIGALVGYNVRGIVLNCHSVGVVTGDRDVGGLVGDNFRGSVSDCYSGCVVSGTSPVGGLVGNNNGSVTHCHSFGQTTATGLGYAGGLVGYNWGDVSNSYSLGEVTGGRWFSDAGGLIGYNGGTVSDCHSTATVRGEDTVGGLIAHNRDYYASVTNCFSAGVVVTDGWDAGGLIGNNHYAKVSKCYSTSVVTGNRDVGGLVGENHLGDVSDCYSSGSVTGRNGVGGLVGRNLGSLTNCYSTSVIVGIGDLGGLVGRSGGKATAEGSFWDMDTSGQDYSAGGMGLTTGEMQTASTYLVAGWDFLGEVENGVEDIWWIEDGRDYPHLWWEPTGVNAAVGADLPGEG